MPRLGCNNRLLLLDKTSLERLRFIDSLTMSYTIIFYKHVMYNFLSDFVPPAHNLNLHDHI